MKRRMNVVALATMMLGAMTLALVVVSLIVLTGCSTSQPDAKESYESFAFEPRDWNADEPRWVKQVENWVQSQQEPISEPVMSEVEYVDESEYYEPYGGSYSVGYSGDGFMQQGVRAGVDSATETWYSSNTLYHYRTSEWTVDGEGYYRDSDGYYVVSSNDYAQGSVVNTSKGAGKVYDDGTASGNIDMYVNW